MIKELLGLNPLFVFALEAEATDKFEGFHPLFIGVGKVNAAYHLTKRIKDERPSIIVNLGSAGSNTFDKGSVVCCAKFIQRDMDATIMGCEQYATPFSNVDPILSYGIEVEGVAQAVCGTGDSFDVSHTTTIYNVVDMEAYSLAYIAQQEKIPFLCLKYISDGADDSAVEDWGVTVHNAAEALKKVIDEINKSQ